MPHDKSRAQSLTFPSDSVTYYIRLHPSDDRNLNEILGRYTVMRVLLSLKKRDKYSQNSKYIDENSNKPASRSVISAIIEEDLIPWIISSRG